MPAVAQGKGLGDDLVCRINDLVKTTHDPRVIETPLKRRRLFSLDYNDRLLAKNYAAPVMVSATSGAPGEAWGSTPRMRGRFAAAHAANSVACLGGEPLFADYHIRAPRGDIEDIAGGMVEACKQAHCALLDGVIRADDGRCEVFVTCVGIAERARLMATRTAHLGDAVVGVEGSGVQAVFSDDPGAAGLLARHSPPMPLAEPPRSYCLALKRLQSHYRVKKVVTGAALCAGDGLVGALARVVPPGLGFALSADKDRGAFWKSVCEALDAEPVGAAKLSHAGFGMVLTVAPYYAAHVCEVFRRAGEKPVLLGRLQRAEGPITVRKRERDSDAG